MKFSAVINDIVVYRVEIDAADHDEALAIIFQNECDRYEILAKDHKDPVVVSIEQEVAEGD